MYSFLHSFPHSSIQVRRVLETMQVRGVSVSKDDRVRFVAGFENHGIRSGGSLEHPHFQLLGLPIVPTATLGRLLWAQNYFDKYNKCVFCQTLEDEKSGNVEGDGSRVVFENDEFLCFVPFAATRSHQLWIVPKEHRACFYCMEPRYLPSLAAATKACLEMLYYALDDPDYNLIVRSVPVTPKVGHNHEDGVVTRKRWGAAYHWYFEITPHISSWGGVACCDVVVHKMTPATMAKQLAYAYEDVYGVLPTGVTRDMHNRAR
eukprot:GHVU01144926.1.p1 GENE.GHVU01144926.1~~GHVU01144926.1.p1  ORF type:complete len:261 (+),score=25.83 GHVU01144926.1:241-1023(+)